MALLLYMYTHTHMGHILSTPVAPSMMIKRHQSEQEGTMETNDAHPLTTVYLPANVYYIMYFSCVMLLRGTLQLYRFFFRNEKLNNNIYVYVRDRACVYAWFGEY